MAATGQTVLISAAEGCNGQRRIGPLYFLNTVTSDSWGFTCESVVTSLSWRLAWLSSAPAGDAVSSPDLGKMLPKVVLSNVVGCNGCQWVWIFCMTLGVVWSPCDQVWACVCIPFKRYRGFLETKYDLIVVQCTESERCVIKWVLELVISNPWFGSIKSFRIACVGSLLCCLWNERWDITVKKWHLQPHLARYVTLFKPLNHYVLHKRCEILVSQVHDECVLRSEGFQQGDHSHIVAVVPGRCSPEIGCIGVVQCTCYCRLSIGGWPLCLWPRCNVTIGILFYPLIHIL